MENYLVVAAFVIAELLGALIYFKTEDSVKRTLLTCLGLGFAFRLRHTMKLSVSPGAPSALPVGGPRLSPAVPDR